MTRSENDRPIIGLLINRMEGPYQSLIRQGLANFTEDAGFSLRVYAGRSLGSPYGNEDSFNSIYDLARGTAQESAPAGLVVTAGSIGSYLEPRRNREFLESFSGIPLVTVGLRLEGFPCVDTDGAGGMTALMEHMVTVHGFSRFAFLAGSELSQDAALRFTAWKETLDRFGIPQSRRIVYRGDLSFRSGQAAAYRIDASAPLPFDLISCANDDMALGFIQAMARRGILCPRDYAVTGFDDIPDAGFLSPLLSTVHQPLYEQAYNAGRLLARKMADPSAETLNDRPLPCVPVFRESCGCAPAPLLTMRKNALGENDGERGPGGIEAPFESLHRELQCTDIARDRVYDAYTSLVNSASLDLRKFVERPLFLQVLSGLLDATCDWDDYSNRWHVLLSHVRRRVGGDFADSRALRYTEDLFSSAFALLTQKTSERHAREVSVLRETQLLIRELSHSLNSISDVSPLRDILAQTASAMGFSRITLALHEDGPKPFEPWPPRGFYGDIKTIDCPGETGDRGSVYMPLLGDTRSFGYIRLEGTGIDSVVYESLREQISQALESISRKRERENAEGKARANEERYREMVSSLPVMVLETDTMLGIVYANAHALESLAIGDTGAATSLKKFLETDDGAAIAELMKRLVAERKIEYPGFRLIIPGYPRYIPVARIVGIFDPSGHMVGLRWIAYDPLAFIHEGPAAEDEFFAERHITRREREIIELQLQGYRIRDIAARLFIAESTVKGHLTQIYNKFGIDGKSELYRLFREPGDSRFGINSTALSLVHRLLSVDEPS